MDVGPARAWWRTLRVYAAHGPWPLFRAFWRFTSAPLRRVAAFVPRDGIVVDVGCGQGHFLRYCHELGHRRLVGIEPSPRALARARKCLPAHVALVRGRAEALPLREAATVAALDVLYLLEPQGQEMFIAQAASVLRRGGLLLIKTMEPSRTVRQMVNRIQEWIAVKVLRITLGRDFSFRTARDWVALCEAQGLHAQTVPLWRGYLHPHVLIVARRGDAPPDPSQGHAD